MKKLLFIFLLCVSVQLFAVELLVFNKAHWMDALSVAEVTDRTEENEHFQQRYDARYQRGDIIEVRPDGYWTDGKRKGFGSHAFALIIIPGVSVDDAQGLMGALEDKTDPENPIRLKRRQYKVDMAQVVLSADKKATYPTVISAPLVDKSKVQAIE